MREASSNAERTPFFHTFQDKRRSTPKKYRERTCIPSSLSLETAKFWITLCVLILRWLMIGCACFTSRQKRLGMTFVLVHPAGCKGGYAFYSNYGAWRTVCFHEPEKLRRQKERKLHTSTYNLTPNISPGNHISATSSSAADQRLGCAKKKKKVCCTAVHMQTIAPTTG